MSLQLHRVEAQSKAQRLPARPDGGERFPMGIADGLRSEQHLAQGAAVSLRIGRQLRKAGSVQVQGAGRKAAPARHLQFDGISLAPVRQREYPDIDEVILLAWFGGFG